MSQHYSGDRLVIPRRRLEQRNIPVLHMPDKPPRGYLVNGLRSVGVNSEVRLYRAVSDGNGDYVRDSAGNPVLGERIKN